MLNQLKMLLPLMLMLGACAPRVATPGAGRMQAVAYTPAAQFEFNCDPTTQAGTPVLLGTDDTSFSCPSTDGKARLTLLITSVSVRSSVPGETTTQTVASAVLLINGTPPATYSGSAGINAFTQISNRRMDGDFSANFGQGVWVKGKFWLRS